MNWTKSTKIIHGACAYIDFLGFSRLTENLSTQELKIFYEVIIESIASTFRRMPQIMLQSKRENYLKSCNREIDRKTLNCMKTLCRSATKPLRIYWFSDTILIYTVTPKRDAFHSLANFTSNMFKSLLTMKIPVRAAISFGEFYANIHKHYFFGKAILEAYRYTEKQDWIGLIITPSARAELLDGSTIGPRGFCFYDVPFHNNSKKNLLTLHLGTSQDKIYQNLSAMRNALAEAEVTIKEKYKRTIQFIEQNIPQINGISYLKFNQDKSSKRL